MCCSSYPNVFHFWAAEKFGNVGRSKSTTIDESKVSGHFLFEKQIDVALQAPLNEFYSMSVIYKDQELSISPIFVVDKEKMTFSDTLS